MNTSRQAYEKSKQTIASARDEILDWIRRQPEPVTAEEAAKAVEALVLTDHHNLPTRVYELAGGGALERVGRRRCRVTGNMASVFRATGRPYRPPSRQKRAPNTRRQGLLEAIEEARELASIRPDATDLVAALIDRLQDLIAGPQPSSLP